MQSLVDYGSASDTDNDAGGSTAAAVAAAAGSAAGALGIARRVSAAPAVAAKPSEGTLAMIDSHRRELTFNPRAEDLYAPVAGPMRQRDALALEQAAAGGAPGRPLAAGLPAGFKRNTWNGYIEEGEMNEFQFENQRLTMQALGYAMDPSSAAGHGGPSIVGDLAKVQEYGGESLVHTKPKKADRKRKKGTGPDGENYLGPWAQYEDEQEVAMPSAEQMETLAAYAKVRAAQKLERRAARGGRIGLPKTGEEEEEDEDEAAAKRASLRDEETTILHLPEAVDYQGRTFMEPPLSEGVRFGRAPDTCRFPQKLIHTWDGHSKGVAAVRFLPKTAHLLLSAGMDSLIKLWEVYGERRLVRSYVGSQQAVRDIAFNADGSRFVSCGYDRLCRVWDTETGKCIGRYTNKKIPYCVKFHPADDKQHLFVAGTQDKKIVCYDINSGQIVQEYDRHLGAVNTISFIEEGRKMVTTSDDKSIRIWEWDIPVDIKYIADPAMHSMPSVATHPNGKYMIFQSMDNQIVTYACGDRFRQNSKKTFKGHIVSGYACQVNFSPDGSFVVSGDAHGNCYFWEWKNRRIVNKLRAHDKVCVGVEWNPNEVSKVVTCGWDGAIKYWA